MLRVQPPPRATLARPGGQQATSDNTGSSGAEAIGKATLSGALSFIAILEASAALGAGATGSATVFLALTGALGLAVAIPVATLAIGAMFSAKVAQQHTDAEKDLGWVGSPGGVIAVVASSLAGAG